VKIKIISDTAKPVPFRELPIGTVFTMYMGTGTYYIKTNIISTAVNLMNGISETVRGDSLVHLLTKNTTIFLVDDNEA
jgi:hypothetical protein